MLLFNSVTNIRAHLATLRQQGKTIGFVPTMGALHRGHMALIEAAARQTDQVVCTIFVNPTQFNNPSDFNQYPRNTQTDTRQLENSDCGILYLPQQKEIYPDAESKKVFDPGRLVEVLEGRQRPGHFQGVMMVVRRLLEIIEPDMAFFGRKDYQQLLVVEKLVEHYALNTQIVGVDIVREASGLALSSRNQLLSHEQKEKALVLYHTLSRAKEMTAQQPAKAIAQWGFEQLQKSPGVNPEYFAIVNAHTLEPLETLDGTPAIALTAAWAGGVRLIDNLPLNK